MGWVEDLNWRHNDWRCKEFWHNLTPPLLSVHLEDRTSQDEWRHSTLSTIEQVHTRTECVAAGKSWSAKIGSHSAKLGWTLLHGERHLAENLRTFAGSAFHECSKLRTQVVRQWQWVPFIGSSVVAVWKIVKKSHFKKSKAVLLKDLQG